MSGYHVNGTEMLWAEYSSCAAELKNLRRNKTNSAAAWRVSFSQRMGPHSLQARIRAKMGRDKSQMRNSTTTKTASAFIHEFPEH